MRRLLLALPIPTVLPAAASAGPKHPADGLGRLPISTHAKATHCSPRSRPGVERLTAWLGDNARGVSSGSWPCEQRGRREASLRAFDRYLDATRRSERRAAGRLIDLLPATDRAGNEQAPAGRMGMTRAGVQGKASTSRRHTG